jgi:hypothetical protein
MPSRLRLTLKLVTISPRGNWSDRVLGGQVYRTLTQNAFASRMLIDQLTQYLPKDNEEVNAHVKYLQTMLDVATVVDPPLDRDDEAQGHELDHWMSPRGDSANSLTPLEEHNRR